MTDQEWPDVGGGHGPRDFGLRTSVQAGEMIVEVVGELDFATAPLLDEVLSRDGAVAIGRVVVDVSQLTFGELVVRGASGILRRVVELTELGFLLEDTDSAAAAGAVSCQGLRGRNLGGAPGGWAVCHGSVRGLFRVGGYGDPR